MDRAAEVTPQRCRHCGRHVYLQDIPIPNPNFKRALFNYQQGGVHECIVRPLDRWKRKMIQEYMLTNRIKDNYRPS